MKHTPEQLALQHTFAVCQGHADALQDALQDMQLRALNGASWQQDGRVHPYEANYLKLDISKAKANLDWQPRWSLQQALHASVEWHQQWLAGANMKAFTMVQIDHYQ